MYVLAETDFGNSLSDFVGEHKKLPVHVNLSRLMFHHVEIFAAEMILANRAKKKKNKIKKKKEEEEKEEG